MKESLHHHHQRSKNKAFKAHTVDQQLSTKITETLTKEKKSASRLIIDTSLSPPTHHQKTFSFFICTMLQFLTLAAFEELGSSKSFQMTFLRLAQHIPSNGCGCKGNFLPDNHQFPSDANFFAPKTFITTIFLFREGSFEIRFRFSQSSTQRL